MSHVSPLRFCLPYLSPIPPRRFDDYAINPCSLCASFSFRFIRDVRGGVTPRLFEVFFLFFFFFSFLLNFATSKFRLPPRVSMIFVSRWFSIRWLSWLSYPRIAAAWSGQLNGRTNESNSRAASRWRWHPRGLLSPCRRRGKAMTTTRTKHWDSSLRANDFLGHIDILELAGASVKIGRRTCSRYGKRVLEERFLRPDWRDWWQWRWRWSVPQFDRRWTRWRSHATLTATGRRWGWLRPVTQKSIKQRERKCFPWIQGCFPFSSFPNTANGNIYTASNTWQKAIARKAIADQRDKWEKKLFNWRNEYDPEYDLE